MTPARRFSPVDHLIDALGGTDIYLLDQILKGHFPADTRILDAGCGGGRNIAWFLKNGYDVAGVDGSAAAIEQVKRFSAAVAPLRPPGHFRAEPVENLSFPDTSFDAVLSIAVLHFARDDAHFLAMVREMWRVLRPGGFLFARLASTTGIETLVRPLGNGLYSVPDGSVRYLVDLETLLRLGRDLGGELLEPIKTVNVQNLRCMTTWVLRKVM